jgi:hypothetical protein
MTAFRVIRLSSALSPYATWSDPDGCLGGTGYIRVDGQDCFGCCHYGYLSALAIRAPAVLRHVDGFPARGLLRPLRRHEPRGPKAIPCPYELT